MGSETVVVQVEVLKRDVSSEESYQRGGGVEAECIIVKVDGGKVRQVLNRRKEGGDGLGNLA